MAWQNTTVTKTLSFVNSVLSSFTSPLNVSCAYASYVAPSFASVVNRTLNVTEIISGLESEWKLPTVTEGSFAPTRIRFTPIPELASMFAFNETSKTVTYNGTEYNESLTNTTVTFVMTDTDGNSGSPYS